MIDAKELSKNYSLIPLNGKRPIENGWQKHCLTKRVYNESDFPEGSNVGITCGPASGILVLDIDNIEAFNAAKENNKWELPETKTIRTGSGGIHYYFKYPKNGGKYGNRAFKQLGFDIRGEGGVVVAPGSIHPKTGRKYQVEIDVPEAPAPEWLLKLAKEDSDVAKENSESLEDLEPTELDIDTLDLSPRIKSLITEGTDKGKRSEAMMSVLIKLVALELTNSQILSIFENHPIGEKYTEKGKSRWKWLAPQIEKARRNVRPTLDSEMVLKALNDSEVGDARLFNMLNRGKLCFDHSISQWFKWNGANWEKDSTREAQARIGQVVEVYEEEALRQNQNHYAFLTKGKGNEAKTAEKNHDNLLIKKRKLQKLQRRKNVLTLAASGGSDSLGISGNEWDKCPSVLGCKNGVIDLKTGEFSSSRPEDYIKTISPIEWKGIGAAAPTWEKFLDEIFQEKQELIDYIHRLLGYSILGEAKEHVLPILWGQGRNGKGTLLESLKHVLGPLANPIPSETLLSQKYSQAGSSHTADLMLLRGLRLGWTSEIDEGRSFSLAKVKWLVGGDTITARPPHGKDFINFKPTHALFLLTNSKPHASSEDYAFWKRVHLIPFGLSFVSDPSGPNERQADPNLSDKLKAEAPGILAWLVRGCLKYQEQGGLNPPEIVKEATSNYRSEEDVFGRFIEDCCELNEKASAKAGELYDAYKAWCKDNGHGQLSSTKFGKKLGERFEKKKSNGVHYKGLCLSTAIAEDYGF